MLTKNRIKSILDLKKWSIRCERVQEILNSFSSKKISDVVCVKSSDYHFAQRNHRGKYSYLNNYHCYIVGCDQNSNRMNYYTYLLIKI